MKFTSNPQEAGALAAKMIGSNLITKQTTATGQPCHKVFVGESVDLASEKYFAILMDRSHNGPVMVGSAQGGMDIEAVAEATPDAIFTLPIDITKGINHPPSPHLAFCFCNHQHRCFLSFGDPFLFQVPIAPMFFHVLAS